MPLYRYKAVSPAGDVSTGEFEAPQEAAVVYRLRDMGLLPVRIDLAEQAGATAGPRESFLARLFRKRKVGGEDILALTRELGTLLRAGLPLDRALEILINLSSSDPVRLLLQQIRDDVRGGSSLSQALDAHQGMFSRFYVNIVRAGEAGGALPAVLVRLSEFMERSKDLRDTVVSALIYPVILVGVAVLSVILLLIYVVPQFSQMFHDAGKALPLPTQIVIASGNFLRYYWWVLVLAVIAGVFWWRGQRARPESRYRWDARFLRAPLFGDLIAKIEVARFARTLGTLLGNGVTLLAGLSIVKETMTNTVLAGGLEGVIAKLREGQGLGRPLLQAGLYPKLAIHMVLVGEETGRLEEMLLRVADVYDREVQTSVKRLLALLEPLLILGLAAVIAGIILSILLALLGINDLAL
jgi:general secretion pathway protein F